MHSCFAFILHVYTHGLQGSDLLSIKHASFQIHVFSTFHILSLSKITPSPTPPIFIQSITIITHSLHIPTLTTIL